MKLSFLFYVFFATSGEVIYLNRFFENWRSHFVVILVYQMHHRKVSAEISCFGLFQSIHI